ncbi:LacI family DNA-binding transcriptional regulator [Knoellia sp. S7-12]|uniref:LacI family DNA-binding transcriptional regulator n=1 Tax=Knoellia sp. S7-12 TaxID=3126698 RepID=UPI003369878E
MPHGPHRHEDIASQAGVSVATVDRVVHGRPGASARAVRAVERAVLELDRQLTQVRLGVRSLVLDLVMQAPKRFSEAVSEALEAELPGLHPATVRARFHLRESGSVEDLLRVLDRIGTRGQVSDGVLLKAPDDPAIGAAVDRLAARGIPVVTFVTDVRESARVAYLGPDNAGAGATAAYLVRQWLGAEPGACLVTLSRSAFYGERERLDGFCEALARTDPDRDVVVLADADGLDLGMSGLVRELLAGRRDIAAVYSAGGGNRAIAAELAAAGVLPRLHLGHDLDADNVGLLRDGTLHAVLHHDLRADLGRASRQLLRAHNLLPGAPTSFAAPVQVVTPHNLPPRLGPST